jgi:hypothetical protein
VQGVDPKAGNEEEMTKDFFAMLLGSKYDRSSQEETGQSLGFDGTHRVRIRFLIAGTEVA